MASGKLGTATLEPGVWTMLYIVPTDSVAELNINMISRGAQNVAVQMAISDDPSATPPYKDIIILNPGGTTWPRPYQRHLGFFASGGEKVMAWAGELGISVRVDGLVTI